MVGQEDAHLEAEQLETRVVEEEELSLKEDGVG